MNMPASSPAELAAKESRLGVALIAAGACGFSSTIVFARSLASFSPLSLAFFRTLSSFLFFCVLLRLRKTAPAALFPRPRKLGLLLGLGLSVGATGMLYLYALNYTSAANAVLLNNTSVIYVALLAPWLLAEKRSRYTWPSVVLAMLGIVCVADPVELARSSGFNTSLAGVGIATAALSGVTYAFTMLLSRLLREEIDPIVQIWWSTGIASLMTLPWAFQYPSSLVVKNLPFLIAIGVVGQGGPYLLYFLGLKRTPAQVVSIVALLEPVLGMLMGVLIYNEIPNALGIVGVVLVLSAIMLVSR